MVKIAQAPLRVSFSGGGTDIGPYVGEYGGCVLASAIKVYAQAIYPSAPVMTADMEQTIMDYFELKDAVKITNGAPQMSGLGGSASCFVAGIKAVAPHLSKEEIALTAFHLERDILNITGGKQDQYCASYGGMLLMEFKNGKTQIEKITPPPNLSKLLLLVYMGKRKDMGQDIIKDQMGRDNLLGFHRSKGIARNMKQCLSHNNLIGFGELLNEAWQIKQRYTPMMATGEIIDFYDNCLTWGAIGGKLTGAGGGGFMLLMEHPNKWGQLRTALMGRNIKYHVVEFDIEGVKII